MQLDGGSAPLGPPMRSQGDVRNEVAAAMRRSAMEFESANLAGDGAITLEQFEAMLSLRLKFPADQPKPLLKEWFDTLVADNDRLSLDEFFYFCIFEATQALGPGSVEAIFKDYDKDNSGVLSHKEFGDAIREMGFAAVTDKLFEAFDRDHSGELDYDEVITTIHDQRQSPALKSLCQVLNRFNVVEPKAAADSVDAVRAELERLLKDNAVRVMGLFEEMDEDSSGLISARELRKVLEHLGYKGKKSAVHKLFNEIDYDTSFSVSFDEMNDWLHGGVQTPGDDGLTWAERARKAAEDEAAAKARLSRPQSARPTWRPVGNRPSWPLDVGLRREQERSRLIAPPSPTSPRTPRPRFGHRVPGYQPRIQVCELRDIPRLKARAAASGSVGAAALPELYISRKLNWPPRGLMLEPQITERGKLTGKLATQVCATERPHAQTRRPGSRPASARLSARVA